MKQESTVYYHYTSVSALYEIINNKTLLLSGVQSLNDMEEEMILIISLISKLTLFRKFNIGNYSWWAV